MYIHLYSGDGRYAIESFDLVKKTITTRYKTIPFTDVRLIKDVFGEKDRVLEQAILSEIAPIYKSILIPKKSGGVREVYSLLEPYNSEQKKTVKKLKLKMLSVKDCAIAHKGAKTIINLDIEKAFSSVILGKNVNTDNKVFKYSFSKEGMLLQGTPCSSYIFEQVLNPIFDKLTPPFENLVVTRYVDDITISCKKKLSEETVQEIIDYITNYLLKYGFKINSKKTRCCYDNGKGFKVLGIALSQDRIGVRNMKKQAILYWKKGEQLKAEGMLSYLKSFLDVTTYNNLKNKFAVKCIDKSDVGISTTNSDLPF